MKIQKLNLRNITRVDCVLLYTYHPVYMDSPTSEQKCKANIDCKINGIHIGRDICENEFFRRYWVRKKTTYV